MAEANKPVPKATTTVFGKVILCTVPLNPANPIVVGCNDPRLGAPVVTPQGSEILTAVTGGQALATQSTKQNILVDNVATIGFGVKTVAATVDANQNFRNRGINSMNVYPQIGAEIYRGLTSLGVNQPYPVASKANVSLYCFAVNKWRD